MARLIDRPDGARADPDEGLARMRTLVSPYTGVVRALHQTLRTPDDARMTLVGARIAATEPTTASPFPLSSAGADYEPERAVAAALGEALERYAGTCLPGSGTVLATADELGPSAVAPERWTLFSPAQYAQDGFPFVPFDRHTRVRWVRGWSLPDRAAVYLPLQLVYMVRQDMLVPGEARIAEGSSSGMALAVDPVDATLGGLLELVERDAVMVTWAARLVHPRLDWSGDPELLAREARHFAPTGLRYQALDLSGFFGIPTAFALMLRAGELVDGNNDVDAVVWGIGAASAPSMRVAWDKALRECFQTRSALRVELLERPGRCRLDADAIEDPPDHLYYYARAEHQAKLDFLVSSERTRAVGDVPDLEGLDPTGWISAVTDRLDRHGVRAYAAEITPPDLADAGLHVIHVLSPELQPVDFPHRRRVLGGRRLYEAARDGGWRDRPLTPADLNPDPHPFP